METLYLNNSRISRGTCADCRYLMGLVLHAYPKTSGIEAWKSQSPGAKVRFRASVTGVSGMTLPIRGGLTQYGVLLEEAELLPAQ